MMRTLAISLAAAAVVVLPFARSGLGAPGGVPMRPIAVPNHQLPIHDLGRGHAKNHGTPPIKETQTIPFWSSSFVNDGQTFPFIMVGTDPALGPATTVIHAKIIPLRLVFRSDGQVLYDPGMAADALASPVFTPVDIGLGPLQWHELIQHISLATDPGYRVILDPEVLPAETLSVPADKGFTTFDQSTQRRVGVVTFDWSLRKAKELTQSHQISPNDLVIFLVDNVIGSLTTIQDCQGPQGCLEFAGWHEFFQTGGRGPVQPPTQVNTMVWADREDLGAALPPGVDFRSAALSHEIAEWAADPFIANIVPEWFGPFAGAANNCSNLLEVADPVENLPIGVVLPDGRLTAMTNAATLSWFAREVPSRALFGLYDLTGTLTTPSAPCP
jgi:hypothetical protein